MPEENEQQTSSQESILPNAEDLNEALAELDTQYHASYKSPDAIRALMKTIKSFNITIKDWNLLVDYIDNVGSTISALYQIMPELNLAIQRTYKDAVTGMFTSTEVVVDFK